MTPKRTWDFLRARLDRLLPRGSLRERFLKGAFWLVFGAFIAQGFAFCASVLVARVLGPETYGVFGIIQSTVVSFAMLAGLALGVTATKHVAEHRHEDPERAGRITGLSMSVGLISSGIVAVVIYLLAPYLARRLAEHTWQIESLTLGFRIGCLMLVLEVLDGVLIGYLAGMERFKTLSRNRLFRGLLNFPIMVLGVHYWGLVGTIWGLIAVRLCAFLIDYHSVRRVERETGVLIRYRGALRELPILWRFAVPGALSSALYGPAIWMANVMLVASSGFSELGLFNAANKLGRVIIMMGIPIGAVLLPILMSREGGHSRMFQKTNVLATWLVGIVIAVPGLCFPQFFGMIFGRDYAGEPFNQTLSLIVLAAVIRTYKSGLARNLIARGLMWWGFLDNLLWAGLFLGTMALYTSGGGEAFLMVRGSVALAGAYAIGYGLNTIIVVSVYVRMGLAPREILWSTNVFCIWLALGVAVAMNFYAPTLPVRVVAAVILCAVMGLLVRRILKSRHKEDEVEMTPPVVEEEDLT